MRGPASNASLRSCARCRGDIRASLILAGYGLEAPLTVLALALAAARGRASQRRLTTNTELSIRHSDALCGSPLRPARGGVVGGASMLGDPELRLAPSRSGASAQVGDLHKPRFISGAATGLAAQATISIVPSTFGGLIAATLVGRSSTRFWISDSR